MLQYLRVQDLAFQPITDCLYQKSGQPMMTSIFTTISVILFVAQLLLVTIHIYESMQLLCSTYACEGCSQFFRILANPKRIVREFICACATEQSTFYRTICSLGTPGVDLIIFHPSHSPPTNHPLPTSPYPRGRTNEFLINPQKALFVSHCQKEMSRNL